MSNQSIKSPMNPGDEDEALVCNCDEGHFEEGGRVEPCTCFDNCFPDEPLTGQDCEATNVVVVSDMEDLV